MKRNAIFFVALMIGSSAAAMEQARAAMLIAMAAQLIEQQAPARPDVQRVHDFKEKQKHSPKDKQPKRSGKGKHIVHQPR